LKYTDIRKPLFIKVVVFTILTLQEHKKASFLENRVSLEKSRVWRGYVGFGLPSDRQLC